MPSRSEMGLDGVVFEILHPDVKIYQNLQRKTNPSSCVLKITAAYGSILMPADIYRQSEKWLLEHFSDKLPSTVLVAPHHGSLTSSSKAFIRAVNPELTVFTVGYLNRFGHPHPEVIERYRILGSILLRSDWHGAVQVRFEREGVSLKAGVRKTYVTGIKRCHHLTPETPDVSNLLDFPGLSGNVVNVGMLLFVLRMIFNAR